MPNFVLRMAALATKRTKDSPLRRASHSFVAPAVSPSGKLLLSPSETATPYAKCVQKIIFSLFCPCGMLFVETKARIRHKHFIRGKTIKEIARDLKVSRNKEGTEVGRDLIRV
jgi:hypothetical protein